MFSIRRFYNQNKKTIWIGILGLAAIMITLRILNNFTIQKNNQKNQNINNNIVQSTYIDDPGHAIVTEETVSKKTNEEITTLIDTFIKYCNEDNIEQAYNMLSDDCKKELFSSLEKFTTNYYNNIFTSYKTYNIQAWVIENNVYTYKVRITDDILATRENK